MQSFYNLKYVFLNSQNLLRTYLKQKDVINYLVHGTLITVHIVEISYSVIQKIYDEKMIVRLVSFFKSSFQF